MGAPVFYLLILQKYDNSKQNTLKYLGNILGDFSANNMIKKQDSMGVRMIFMLIIGLLILVILPIFTNI